MRVKHCLARRTAVVNAQIEPLHGRILRLHGRRQRFRQAMHRSPFIRRHLSEGGHMPSRHDQNMAAGNRIFVAKRHARTILRNNPLHRHIAKRA